MWRRRDSDCVHSQRRFQASSRERSLAMAPTLAQRSGFARPPFSPPATLGPSHPQSRAIPMEKFVIEGGVPLSGTIVPAGNKNGALPLLAATVLTGDRVVLRNVPRIADVEAMVGLLEHLGATVDWLSANDVSISAAELGGTEVDRELSERIRASFLLAGPLLARFGRALMPPPGGDVIGRRRLDPHLDAFKALGATIDHQR